MRRRRAVAVRMVVAVAMPVMVVIGWNHMTTLYYNITSAKRRKSTRDSVRYGLPMTMAMAAARNGNGIETAALNQTNRAGMNGISQSSSRWKANSAQAIT
jgi:hypothetical protein